MPVLVCQQMITDNALEFVQTQLVGSIQMTNGKFPFLLCGVLT